MSYQDQAWTAWETLAWAVWRNKKAVNYFSTDGFAKWEAALKGEWPDNLGIVKVTPAQAERELQQSLDSGALLAISK